MTNDIVRVGIIGCGGIANGKHMPALSKLKNVKMVAFCDIIEKKALAAREKFGTPDCAVYTDYKKLLEDKSIDVVHVLTPNRSHSFITVDALEAGKHVMCEKPMAINSDEAQKMLDAAKRTGKKLTIGYQSRHRTDSLFLKGEVEAGTFGDIYYAKATAIRRRAVPTWGVFLNEYEQGGGPLIDIGTHALDLTLWTLDNYKPKYCVGTTYHALNDQTDQGNAWGPWDPAKFTVEDSAFGFIVMENGATINLEASWALNTLDVREAVTSFCGTKAGADMVDGVRINGVRQNLQYVMKPDMNAKGAAFFDGVKGESPADREARLWIDAVVNDKAPFVLPEQAIVVTKILEGIYTSAKTGDIFRF
ncbi:MAG: Gfo/Idh/MocA family oxidoreductase [Clostridiales bacterium]|nr:Gfo/Idh/MocA family oxidoreductase [Clostridiales bacterium]MDD7595877.1 Gfo/Idh/MocA family oxidoreductase [Clostridiales bacterium]